MIFSILLLIAGLAILIKGADILVLGSVSIAKRFGISSLVIGLTIVAFGTSLPELIVSVFASFKNNSDIALGNVIGSNISNILFILGLTSVLSTIPVRDSTVWKEIPFSLLAIVAVGLLGADIYFRQGETNFISRADGFILLLFFVIFLYYVFQISRGEENEDKIEKIKICILDCSFSKGVIPHLPESKILQDADGLESTGLFFVMRTFSCTGQMQRSFYDLLDPFCNSRKPNSNDYAWDLIYERLPIIVERMHTKTAKNIAKRRTNFLLKLLKEFKLEMA